MAISLVAMAGMIMTCYYASTVGGHDEAALLALWLACPSARQEARGSQRTMLSLTSVPSAGDPFASQIRIIPKALSCAACAPGRNNMSEDLILMLAFFALIYGVARLFTGKRL